MQSFEYTGRKLARNLESRFIIHMKNYAKTCSVQE